MIKHGKKEVNKRTRSEYPALNKGLNLSSRKDYIEPDYINGILDDEGNLVIRPCTDDEKKFLNQFYEESIVTNFYHDPDLKRLNREKKAIIEDGIVKDLQKQVKILNDDKEANSIKIRELKEIIKLTKKQNEETYADELLSIEEESKELRQEKLLYPDKEDHKVFYNENNARNNCIFNKLKITKRLVFLESEEYDEFAAEKIKTFDAEEALIQELERHRYEEQEDRLRKVMEEEKTNRKKQKS